MGRPAATTIVASFLVTAFAGAALTVGSVLAADPTPVDQGADWTPAKRDRFYTLDQGSRLMPLSWIKALKLPDGSPFMADSLRRYGFLPNPGSPGNLPVG